MYIKITPLTKIPGFSLFQAPPHCLIVDLNVYKTQVQYGGKITIAAKFKNRERMSMLILKCLESQKQMKVSKSHRRNYTPSDKPVCFA